MVKTYQWPQTQIVQQLGKGKRYVPLNLESMVDAGVDVFHCFCIPRLVYGLRKNGVSLCCTYGDLLYSR